LWDSQSPQWVIAYLKHVGLCLMLQSILDYKYDGKKEPLTVADFFDGPVFCSIWKSYHAGKTHSSYYFHREDRARLGALIQAHLH